MVALQRASKQNHADNFETKYIRTTEMTLLNILAYLSLSFLKALFTFIFSMIYSSARLIFVNQYDVPSLVTCNIYVPS